MARGRDFDARVIFWSARKILSRGVIFWLSRENHLGQMATLHHLTLEGT